MAEEIKDKLAEAIAKRRAEVARRRAGQSAAGVSTETPLPAALARQPDPGIEQKLVNAREAIRAGQNPMAVARLLGELAGPGMKNKDLAAALEVNKSWLSKRLGLLRAPVKVQRLIEAGELPESDYHNNKNVAAQIGSRAGTLEYRRMPTVTISIETARSMAAILRIIAAENGDASIVLLPNASKKDIATLLDLRAGYVLGLIDT